MTDDLLRTFAALNPVPHPDRLVALDAPELPGDPALRALLDHGRTDGGAPGQMLPFDLGDPRFAHPRGATHERSDDVQATKAPPDPQRTAPRRSMTLAAVGAAAVIAVVIAGLVVLEGRGSVPFIGSSDPTPQEIAQGFVDAYAAYDADAAAAYLTADALDAVVRSSIWVADAPYEGLEALRFDRRLSVAQGFKWLLEPCEPAIPTTSGAEVVCPYDFHGLGSDELGRGPYDGSHWALTISDGKIVAAQDITEFGRNEFDSEMAGPFTDWVEDTYPEDARTMYDEANLSDETIALWEQHVRDYVRTQRAGS